MTSDHAASSDMPSTDALTGASPDTRTWVDRFAADLETEPPTDDELRALLALAGVAAHASERTAAPISCWIAARAGVDPGEALERALRLASELGSPAAGSS